MIVVVIIICIIIEWRVSRQPDQEDMADIFNLVMIIKTTKEHSVQRRKNM